MSNTSNQKHVYIAPGYIATPASNWFPWLKEQLAQQGIHATVLAMPTPDKPVLGEWQQYLKEQIGTPDQHQFFVAHSLGCVNLLKYLSTTACKTSIGGLILVSGFDQHLSIIPEIDSFTTAPVDYSKLPDMPQRAVIASTNDVLVPLSYTQALAKKIDAPLHTVENAGHFLGQEGFTTLPIVYDLLMDMLRK